VADARGSSADDQVRGLLAAVEEEGPESLLARLEGEMLEAARRLEFERAASLRDRMDDVRAALASAERMGLTSAETAGSSSAGGRRGPGRGRSRPGRRR